MRNNQTIRNEWPASRVVVCFLFNAIMVHGASAADFEINGHKFTAPDGFLVEHIAGQPLVDRPVSADFDERGRLYVTDSSGSNEHVDVQVKKRPHRIRRLEDTNGDGIFDKSTVYADKLMFPEGAQWFDGSLYVAAPPEIWKFTDADDDGVAEKREVWFDGKTLTHCANDLHGPYLGPDGWMYWCKGAFAEQTYERPGKQPWETKAAHIFRRRPEGGPLEHVMTGGMDNPVEVVFTPGGERIFTTTFLVHPNQGNRDGLLHAVYGGAYGKDHQALGSHPRTGELMPVLAHLGAAAPCGLARLDSDGLGSEYRNNILACLFNMHKITRHALTKQGASFTSDTSDLLVSDNLDFHPTDVLEDADGSVIVVDTGGWFRLCCPTSQLEKADVLGGIYRIRRADAKKVDDPRGRAIAWDKAGDEQLVELLNDERSAVRNQARQRIGKRGTRAIDALQQVLSSKDPHHRLQAVWALTWIDDDRSRELVRGALDDADETVRQAALHSISLRKDKQAAGQLASIVKKGTPHNRRAAAEALGRLGSANDVAKLLAAVPMAILTTDDGGILVFGTNEIRLDRFLEHSLIFAAMELNEPDELRELLAHKNDFIRRAALIALDQMEGGDHLLPADIEPWLASEHNWLNETAWWIAKQHPDWGTTVVKAFRTELQTPTADVQLLERLGDRLRQFVGSPDVQEVIAEALGNPATSEPIRLTLLDTIATSGKRPLPAAWAAPLQQQLYGTEDCVRGAVTAFARLGNGKLEDKTMVRLKSLAGDERTASDIRLLSLAALPASIRELNSSVLSFVGSQLAIDASVTNRSLAVEVLSSTPLNAEQLVSVAGELPHTGVMELQPLMTMFAKSSDIRVGAAVVTALLKSPSATSLFPDRLQEQLAGFGDSIAAKTEPLLEKIKLENQSKLQRVEDVLALLSEADVRRGLRVFQSTKASCIACHRRGYIGGSIGPDLNRIGQVRSERDLLESILFPSLTFVRNYEPVSIVTNKGRIFSGVIRVETEDVLELQLDAQKTIQIDKSTIDERQAGTLSIMPAGLEKQLSPQEFADLVKYLKES